MTKIIPFLPVRFICLLLAIWLFAEHALASTGVPASGPDDETGISVTWTEYWRLIEASRQSLINWDSFTWDEAYERLESIATQLEVINIIVMPSESLVPVDHASLIALIRSKNLDPERAEKMLANLLSERDNLVEGEFSASDRATLDEILARQAFQWKDPQSSQLGELQKLWQRILQKLEILGSKIFGSDEAGYLIGSGAVLFFCVVLLYLFRKILFGFVAEARIAHLNHPGDENLTADTATRRAQSLSQDGDYRSAVRYLYISALLLLEERGILKYDRSKTNRETLRSVVHQPELETPLRYVVEVFDRVWYGFQPLDLRDYEGYQQQVDLLQQKRKAVTEKKEGGG